jgi:transposase
MDEINKIRKAYFTRGESKNAIAKCFKRSWETIDRIVTSTREELENRGKRKGKKKTVITPEVEAAIHALLDEEVERKVRRKQRYTARAIYNTLKERGIYKGSEKHIETTAKRLREERNQPKNISYLPLHFPLGSAIQVDHGEADIIIGGIRFTGYLFIGSVPGEVLRYCQIFPVKSQEAWGEFHERMFRFFGGVFSRSIYDNDSVMVRPILGNEKRQTSFSLSLEEHFGFESHFCNVASGNEKGAVENAVGYCRRNFLPGLPAFSNWDLANQYLEDCSLKNISEGRHYKTDNPLILAFNELRNRLIPLPPRKSWSKSLDCRVDSCQLASIDHHEYSVPEKYVGASVRVLLGVFQIKIFKDDEMIAQHNRQYGNKDSLILDHYLDQLQYKAAAIKDSKVIQNHKFEPILQEMWGRLLERHETKEANRQFVKILLLGRCCYQENLLEAISVCLRLGAINHAAVETTLKRQTEQSIIFDEEKLKGQLKSVEQKSWEFDLSPYAELCVEVKS